MNEAKRIARRIVFEVLTEAARGEGPKADAAKAELSAQLQRSVRTFNKVAGGLRAAFDQMKDAFAPAMAKISTSTLTKAFQEEPRMGSMNDYQNKTAETAIYPGQGTFGGLMYLALKLNGEAGEVAEKIGKMYRDDSGRYSPDKYEQIARELGDVMWYVARIASEAGYSLEAIAEMNLTKLFDRKERGVLGGSGDNR